MTIELGGLAPLGLVQRAERVEEAARTDEERAVDRLVRSAHGHERELVVDDEELDRKRVRHAHLLARGDGSYEVVEQPWLVVQHLGLEQDAVANPARDGLVLRGVLGGADEARRRLDEGHHLLAGGELELLEALPDRVGPTDDVHHVGRRAIGDPAAVELVEGGQLDLGEPDLVLTPDEQRPERDDRAATPRTCSCPPPLRSTRPSCSSAARARLASVASQPRRAASSAAVADGIVTSSRYASDWSAVSPRPSNRNAFTATELLRSESGG